MREAGHAISHMCAHELVFTEAKLFIQLGVRPHCTVYTDNTDTLMFSNDKSIGEAKEKKIQLAETPSPFISSSSTNRSTLCNPLLHLLFSVTVTFFVATIAIV